MRLSSIFILASILLLGIFTYYPSFSAQLFWDDDDFIVQNTYVKQGLWKNFFTAQAVEGAGKVSNYFRPLQFSLYTLFYQLAGLNPFVYHAASILIHIFSSLALFLFLKLLTQKNHLAWLVALIFLLHPIQTEAVSYASGLSDPLQAFFGFSSLIFYLKFQQGKKYATKFYIASLVCYILAILSKESGIIFSGVIFLLTIIPIKHSRFNFQQLTGLGKPLFPFIAASTAYLFYHTRFIDVISMASIWGDIPYAQNTLIRLGQFIALLPKYILLLIAPIQLYYERDFTISILTNYWYLPAFIFITLILSLFIILIIKHKLLLNQNSKLLLFSFLAFFTSLIPYSGIILINGIMYEHFLYVPMVFFFLFCLLYLSEFNIHLDKRLLYFTYIIIFCFFIWRSITRQFDWQDPINFYNQTLKYAPKSFRVMNNLGLEFAKRGELDEAITTYHKAIELNPVIPNSYHNLAKIYLDQNRHLEAEKYFLKAIDADPYFGYAYSELLMLYTNTNQQEKQLKIKEKIAEKFSRN